MKKVKQKSKNKRVVMDETYIRENMTYWVDLLNATKNVVSYIKKNTHI